MQMFWLHRVVIFGVLINRQDKLMVCEEGWFFDVYTDHAFKTLVHLVSLQGQKFLWVYYIFVGVPI